MRWVLLILLLAGCAEHRIDSGTDGTRISFDAALWQAARETIAAFPLVDSDPVTGRLETGWGGPAELDHQQYKLLIAIDYNAIASHAVAITARHRLQAGSDWIEVDPDPAIARRLASAVESRAEELHLRQNPFTR